MSRTFELDDFYRTRAEHLETSGIVFHSRGCIIGFVVSADGGNSGCTVYEGVSNKGRKMYRFKALAEHTIAHAIAQPEYIELGCYVEFDDANVRVTVEYFPVLQKLSK